MGRILPDPPEDSELQRWIDDGVRHAPSGSNIVTVNSPNQEYALTVEVDDPIRGYLIALWTMDGGREDRIAQTVVEDRDLALQVAAEMVAAADDLRGVHENPSLGPETVHREDVERGWINPPDEWDDDDQEQCQRNILAVR